ncbi:UNKNOWN [Stylonychia lemnae]|uniref:Uncharacterized protein n=1 Tax=Stylonychia lemnae TaxID=5949 RepID=A0A078B017_STYLE|nr:UNKNOWN [Stylonychia lemnae]|eukprot:CDW86373.1 UNKNOWN [Stylonychia lemnae]
MNVRALKGVQGKSSFNMWHNGQERRTTTDSQTATTYEGIRDYQTKDSNTGEYQDAMSNTKSQNKKFKQVLAYFRNNQAAIIFVFPPLKNNHQSLTCDIYQPFQSDQSKTNVDVKSIVSAEFKPESNIINLTLSLPRNKELQPDIKENPSVKYNIVKTICNTNNSFLPNFSMNPSINSSWKKHLLLNDVQQQSQTPQIEKTKQLKMEMKDLRKLSSIKKDQPRQFAKQIKPSTLYYKNKRVNIFMMSGGLRYGINQQRSYSLNDLTARTNMLLQEGDEEFEKVNQRLSPSLSRLDIKIQESFARLKEQIECIDSSQKQNQAEEEKEAEIYPPLITSQDREIIMSQTTFGLGQLLKNLEQTTVVQHDPSLQNPSQQEHYINQLSNIQIQNTKPIIQTLIKAKNQQSRTNTSPTKAYPKAATQNLQLRDFLDCRQMMVSLKKSSVQYHQKLTGRKRRSPLIDSKHDLVHMQNSLETVANSSISPGSFRQQNLNLKSIYKSRHNSNVNNTPTLKIIRLRESNNSKITARLSREMIQTDEGNSAHRYEIYENSIIQNPPVEYQKPASIREISVLRPASHMRSSIMSKRQSASGINHESSMNSNRIGVGAKTVQYDDGSLDYQNGRDKSSQSRYYSNGDNKSALKDVEKQSSRFNIEMLKNSKAVNKLDLLMKRQAEIRNKRSALFTALQNIRQFDFSMNETPMRGSKYQSTLNSPSGLINYNNSQKYRQILQNITQRFRSQRPSMENQIIQGKLIKPIKQLYSEKMQELKQLKKLEDQNKYVSFSNHETHTNHNHKQGSENSANASNYMRIMSKYQSLIPSSTPTNKQHSRLNSDIGMDQQNGLSDHNSKYLTKKLNNSNFYQQFQKDLSNQRKLNMRNQTERINHGAIEQITVGRATRLRDKNGGKYVLSKLKIQVSSDTQTFSQLNDQSNNNLGTPMSNDRGNAKSKMHNMTLTDDFNHTLTNQNDGLPAAITQSPIITFKRPSRIDSSTQRRLIIERTIRTNEKLDSNKLSSRVKERIFFGDDLNQIFPVKLSD